MHLHFCGNLKRVWRTERVLNYIQHDLGMTLVERVGRDERIEMARTCQVNLSARPTQPTWCQYIKQLKGKFSSLFEFSEKFRGTSEVYFGEVGSMDRIK